MEKYYSAVFSHFLLNHWINLSKRPPHPTQTLFTYFKFKIKMENRYRGTSYVCASDIYSLRQRVIQLQTCRCKCSFNRYETAQDSASSWNALHLVGMTETHCHPNSPRPCETCECFRCACVCGWMIAVRVWSGHMVIAFAFNALQITCFSLC